jgi:hypothetical protein
MRRTTLAATVAGVLLALLAGCAGTTVSMQRPFAPAATDRFAYAVTTDVEMPADALVWLDTRLRAQLVDRQAATTANREVEINVTRYATRGPVRVDMPLDEISSRVTVKDAGSGAVLGSFIVDSRDKGEWRTPQLLVNEHADRIAATLRGKP